MYVCVPMGGCVGDVCVVYNVLGGVMVVCVRTCVALLVVVVRSYVINLFK